jgi:glycosyltransferase involved in cell wall biosynthesis
VVWLGYVEDMVTLYHAVDAVVLTSFWEGCSIAILEALSMGLPILGTKVGAIEEQTEYENAVIIDLPVDNIIDISYKNMASILYGNQFQLVKNISLGLEKLYNFYKRKEVPVEYMRHISIERAYSLYYHLFKYLNVRGSVTGVHKWLRQIYSSN